MKEAKTTKQPGPKRRSPENTTATFSLSKVQLEAAKALARAQRRSLSNFLQNLLDEEIARRGV